MSPAESNEATTPTAAAAMQPVMMPTWHYRVFVQHYSLSFIAGVVSNQ